MPTRHLKSFAASLMFALLFSSVAPGSALAQRMRRPNAAPNPVLEDEAREKENLEPQRARASFISNAASLPAGTLIVTQMLTKLSSKTAQPGDRLRAKVIVPVADSNGNVLIPVGSAIEGQVQDVLRAKSRRRSGMIEISFDRLRIGDQAIPLRAALAPATAEDRRRFDADGNLVHKGGDAKRTAAFVGGGAGAGAVIGYFTAGALLGAGVGAGVGVAVLLLSKGKEAVVEPGMKIGAELTEPMQLNRFAADSDAPETTDARLDNYPPARDTSADRQADYNDAYPVTPAPVTPRVKPPVAKTKPRATGAATKATTTVPKNSGRALPPVNDTVEPVVNRSEFELVNVTHMLAERGSDDTVRVSITGQTPTAGWRLVPESTIQNGVLNIKLYGAPPRGIAAQVISSANTIVVKNDPNREIQRIALRGANGVRTTVPLTRGEKNNTNSNSAGNTGAAPSSEALSAMGLRIADKSDALVEDYARSLRAWKTNDKYSFENPRTEATPEAQLLTAFDRLSEAANVFRGSLTPEAKRRAVRDVTNSHLQVNRLWGVVKVAPEYKQRWEEIQRDTKQLAASVPNSTTPGPINPNQPRPRT